MKNIFVKILCFLVEITVGTMVWLGLGLTAKYIIGISDYPWVMLVGAIAFVFVSLSMNLVRIAFGIKQ